MVNVRNTRNVRPRPICRLRNMKKSLLHRLLLPEEIIEEILSRLPVKSLLRFRCISKSWPSLIDSDRFIKMHFQNSTNNTRILSHHRVIFRYRDRPVMGECSLQSLLNSKEGSSSIDVSTINEPKAKTGIFVGCCNGMVCFFNKLDGNFFLWNPVTRISAELPKIGVDSSHYVYPKFGFGWDGSSDAYKVFAVLYDHYNARGKIYSSKTNSWKTVDHGKYNFLHGSIIMRGKFVGGKIHWVIDYGDGIGIESFDLESEEFRRIQLSFTPDSDQLFGLGGIKGRLCAIYDHIEQSQSQSRRVDVWVMKEECWFKPLTFTLDISEGAYYALTFLGEGPNGEIFLLYGDTLLVYDPNLDNVFSAAKNVISFSEAHIYVESLISPRKILGH